MTLDDARKPALALPGAAESPHCDCTSIRVRKKIFADAKVDGVRALLRRAWEGKAPKTLVARHPAS